jgi:integrase
LAFGDETGYPVRSCRKRWNRAGNKAGLGELRLRDLRHEAGSECEESGMPLSFVSQMLGYRSLATTARYLSPTTEHLHEVIEQASENRQKAAALAKSLQSGSELEPDSARQRTATPPTSPWFPRC